MVAARRTPGGFSSLLSQELDQLQERAQTALKRDVAKLQERLFAEYRLHVTELLCVVKGLAQARDADKAAMACTQVSATLEDELEDLRSDDFTLDELEDVCEGSLAAVPLASPSAVKDAGGELRQAGHGGRDAVCQDADQALKEFLESLAGDLDAQLGKVLEAYDEFSRPACACAAGRACACAAGFPSVEFAAGPAAGCASGRDSEVFEDASGRASGRASEVFEGAAMSGEFSSFSYGFERRSTSGSMLGTDTNVSHRSSTRSQSKVQLAASAMAKARASIQEEEVYSKEATMLSTDSIIHEAQEDMAPMASMMEDMCRKCGTVFTGDAAFCHSCGHKRPEVPSCGNCGNVYVDHEVFCRRCGSKRPKGVTIICDASSDCSSSQSWEQKTNRVVQINSKAQYASSDDSQREGDPDDDVHSSFSYDEDRHDETADLPTFNFNVVPSSPRPEEEDADDQPVGHLSSMGSCDDHPITSMDSNGSGIGFTFSVSSAREDDDPQAAKLLAEREARLGALATKDLKTALLRSASLPVKALGAPAKCHSNRNSGCEKDNLPSSARGSKLGRDSGGEHDRLPLSARSSRLDGQDIPGSARSSKKLGRKSQSMEFGSASAEHPGRPKSMIDRKSQSMEFGSASAEHPGRPKSMIDRRSMSSTLDEGSAFGRRSNRQSTTGRASFRHHGSQSALRGSSRPVGDIDRISERQSLCDRAEKMGYEVGSMWFQQEGNGHAGPKKRTSLAGAGVFGSAIFGDNEPDPGVRESKWLSSIMMHPTSLKRILWDLIGLVLIAWDCIMVPLEAFDLEDTIALVTMEWMQRVYWTVNVVLSLFLIAYVREDGMSEMRPWKVFRKYVMTWFVLDGTVVAMDWFEVITGTDGTRVSRIGTTLRGVRMIRTVRLFRLLKAPELANKMGMYIPSGEKTGLVATIAKIMIGFWWITHCVACGWYGLGRIEKSQHTKSWLDLPDIRDMNTRALYVLSFHWSLAVFSGDTAIIPPTNMWERVAATIVLFAAMVVSASVVGGITTSMTRLQLILSEQTSKLMALRRFLKDHHISRPLAVRVQRNAQHAMMEEKNKAPESSITLLSILSQPVLVELHFEIHSPILQLHPFLNAYKEINPAGVRRVCHTCVRPVLLHPKDILFSDLESPEEPTMFFVQNGKLIYTQTKHAPEILERGAWMCEAVLWTAWTHCGTVRASIESRLLKLDAIKFQDLISTFPSEHAGLYACEFVEWLNQKGEENVTDRGPPKQESQEMVERAFPDDDSEQYTDRHSSMRRLSDRPLGAFFRRTATSTWGKEAWYRRLCRVCCSCIMNGKGSGGLGKGLREPKLSVFQEFDLAAAADAEKEANGERDGSQPAFNSESASQQDAGQGPRQHTRLSAFSNAVSNLSRPSRLRGSVASSRISRNSVAVMQQAMSFRSQAVNRWRKKNTGTIGEDMEGTFSSPAGFNRVVPAPDGDPETLS